MVEDKVCQLLPSHLTKEHYVTRHLDIYIVREMFGCEFKGKSDCFILSCPAHKTKTLVNLSCLLSNALSLSVIDHPLDRVLRNVISIQIVVSNM